MQENGVLESLSDKSSDHEFYTGVPEGYKPGRTKYIVITGSVISGVGKGTVSSCLGTLLKLYHGLKVSPVKFDGYINLDAGTLNPYRHGEVFVLDDGTECDLDLGTYERMLNQNHTKANYLTTGKIFKSVIDKERAGKYLGRDVQFIPHVTGEIKGFMRSLALKSQADIVLIEVGGTIGDLENSYFIEAMRELAYEEGKSNVCFINVVYILQPGSLGEQKSKAAQLGTKSLMGLGIQPDIIICRANNPVSENVREKISVFSNVPLNRVIGMHNLDSIVKIPMFMKNIGLDSEIMGIVGLKPNGAMEDAGKWEKLDKLIDLADKEITVAMTGKYTGVHDSYLSILKALEHTAPYFGTKVKIKWIETTNIKDLESAREALKGVDGMIVPGGFGSRGVDGKVFCVQHARESGLPFLGLCYGFQMAVIEFARNVAGMADATTAEVDSKAACPVIDVMTEQKGITELGGTMRLGAYPAVLKPGTMVHKLYGKDQVSERHRHRYEVNPDYIEKLESRGLVFSGQSPEGKLMEFLELPSHPFFVATQAHPEFTSRPLNPGPLFKGFIGACQAGSRSPESS